MMIYNTIYGDFQQTLSYQVLLQTRYIQKVPKNSTQQLVLNAALLGLTLMLMRLFCFLRIIDRPEFQFH